MYFSLKAILRNLLLPPADFLLVGMIGALLLRRYRRFGVGLMLLSLTCLWLVSLPAVAEALTELVERYAALDLSQPTDAQAIVVIGGGGVRQFAPEYQASAPADVLLERLTYTAFVERRTQLPVAVSGAPSEAYVMRDALSRDFAIAPRWIEAESRDTFENARLSARILQPAGITRIILVTMSTHMYRATQEFRSAGFEVTPAPCGFRRMNSGDLRRFLPDPGALLRSYAALYELIGEPMRRLQAATGLREHFDREAGGVKQ
jgi:uncharacterized SAM-binding protein YcdF (DUF218 family)